MRGREINILSTLLSRHRLHMELDLQSLFRLLCTARLGPRNYPPQLAFGLIYEGPIGQP
jgi:hypothetical protein